MKISVLIFMTAVLGSVTLVAGSTIDLYSPKQDFRSQKELVLFKGKVDEGNIVQINGMPVPVFKGRFYVKALLNPHQKNRFTVTTISPSGKEQSIERFVEFFPASQGSYDPAYRIDDVVFMPLENEWRIRGVATYLNRLFINNVDIPIQEQGMFEYRIKPQDIASEQHYLALTGMRKDKLVFTHDIGLQDIYAMDERKRNLDYQPYTQIQTAILSVYHQNKWQLLPFTAIQEKMIHQLIQVDSKALHLDHLNIMKKDQNVVVMLPFLYPSMSIENISHQLMLIVQNTIQNAKHISVLWYNQRPNIIEVVYDANLAPYWIVDDVPMDAKDVLSSRLLDTFSAFSFSLGVERLVKN